MTRLSRPLRPGPVPLLLPALGIVAGAGVGPQLHHPVAVLIACALTCLVLAVVGGGGTRRLGVAAGWLLLGAAVGHSRLEPPPPTADEPWVFELELGARPLDERAELRPASALRAWRVGTVDRAPPSWRGPRPVVLRAAPSRTARLGRGSRVLVLGRIEEERSGSVAVHLTPSSPISPTRVLGVRGPSRWLRVVRRRARRILGQTAGPQARDLFVALVLGDRRDLSPALGAAFARTGTAHLLAISGLHVGVCWLAARSLLRGALMRLPPGATRGGAMPTVASVTAWILAATYVLVAGAPVSGRRALAMLAAVVLAGALRRRVSVWNVLCAAVVVVVAADPSAAGALGFQLSVASVAFLLAWTPSSDAAATGWWRKLLRAALVSLATGALGTLATAPLVGRTWGQVPLAGLWANSVAVPLLGVATVPPLILGTLLGALDPRLGAPLVGLAECCATVGLTTILFLADPSRAPQVSWGPSLLTTSAFYAVAALLAAWTRRR
jgi:ComEC/Rec2-related protein